MWPILTALQSVTNGLANLNERLEKVDERLEEGLSTLRGTEPAHPSTPLLRLTC